MAEPTAEQSASALSRAARFVFMICSFEEERGHIMCLKIAVWRLDVEVNNTNAKHNIVYRGPSPLSYFVIAGLRVTIQQG